MALKLNLYHEVEKLRAQRRRDPLKISLIILSVVIAGFAAMYFWELGQLAVWNRDLARKKSEFDSIEPQAKKARELEKTMQQKLVVSDNMVKRIEGRFYWAPLLEQIVPLVPTEVQITKLQGDVTGDSLKKCLMTIDGISAGSDPRKVAEELRQSISESLGKRYKNVVTSFRQLEDGTERVNLDGKTWPTATFAINVQLQAGEEAAATPAPRAGANRKKRG
jgi:Tfp pilus assembly protein PilN